MYINYDDHNGFVVCKANGVQVACFDTYKEAADYIAKGGK